MLISDTHELGCLVWVLSEFSDPMYEDVAYYNSWERNHKPILARSKEGVAHLLRCFGRMGAIAIWADSIEKRRSFSGEAFYNYLKSEGYDVGKSKVVNNPSGSNRTAFYWWYFRTKPSKGVRRSTTPIRRKKVAAKAKATTSRSSAQSRRTR